MPSSSSARRRSESVRGLIPSSERSSSQKRLEPSARSRMIRRVHLPQTTSAVRQTGQRELLIALIGSRLRRKSVHPRFSECSAIASLTEALRRQAACALSVAGDDRLDLQHVDPVARFRPRRRRRPRADRFRLRAAGRPRRRRRISRRRRPTDLGRDQEAGHCPSSRSPCRSTTCAFSPGRGVIGSTLFLSRAPASDRALSHPVCADLHVDREGEEGELAVLPPLPLPLPPLPGGEDCGGPAPPVVDRFTGPTCSARDRHRRFARAAAFGRGGELRALQVHVRCSAA